jgi:glycosyltransferase involved in cell wall biosynthesis
MKTLAVIIPTIEPDNYLERCLASLDQQTLDKELYRVYVILNGRKTPFLSDISTLLKKSRFDSALLYNEIPGVSRARNLALDTFSENFVVFIDDDDYVAPTYLQELLALGTSDIMGISNIVNWEDSSRSFKPSYIGQTFMTIRDGEQSKYRTRKYFSSPCAKILSREMIGASRFNVTLDIGEDALFMALISNNIRAIAKTTLDAKYVVNVRPNSSSRKRRGKIYEIRRTIVTMVAYSRLFLEPSYEKLFIASRMVATLKMFLTRLFAT